MPKALKIFNVRKCISQYAFSAYQEVAYEYGKGTSSFLNERLLTLSCRDGLIRADNVCGYGASGEQVAIYGGTDTKGLTVELRTLRYFLAVAEELNITKAAESLYMTQPALSRQLKLLENELGVQLYERGSHHITLTESGVLLRKYAKEMIELSEAIPSVLKVSDHEIVGTVAIGAGEGSASADLARAAACVQKTHPKITYSLVSGNASDLLSRLDSGSLDFCLIIQPVDISNYKSVRAPSRDRWGLILRKDNPLAQKAVLTPVDLRSEPLIFSEQNVGSTYLNQDYLDWFGKGFSDLNIVATYNLSYNATLFAAAGIGSVVALENQVRLRESSDLVFRPFEPVIEIDSHLIWKKSRDLSPAAEVFLREFESLNKPV